MNHQTANDILGERGSSYVRDTRKKALTGCCRANGIGNQVEKSHLSRNTTEEYLLTSMGLGKTIQTIAVMETNFMPNTLLIVPASLVEQWVAEIKKFSSRLEPIVCINGHYHVSWAHTTNLVQFSSLPTRTFVAHHDLFCSVLVPDFGRQPLHQEYEDQSCYLHYGLQGLQQVGIVRNAYPKLFA